MRFLKCCGFLTILLAAGCSRGPSDEAIATQIKARFYADPQVKASGVTVAVAKGEVTLSGTASSSEVELQAFQLAMGIAGVRRIRDQIVVAAPVKGPQRAAAEPDSPRQLEVPRPAPVSAASVRQELDEYVPTVPPPPEEIRVVRVERPPVEQPPLREITVVAPAPQAPAWGAPPADEFRPPVPDSGTVETPRPKRRERVQLQVAGPSSADLLLSRWSSEFSRVERHVEIQYRSLAAGEGLRNLRDKDIDFAVADVPVSDDHILHFPAAIEGVAVVCNLDDKVVRELMLTGEVLAAIYLGRITRWDHPLIRALNPQIMLPSAEIVPIHRSDKSAANAVFTEFLSARSPDWRAHANSFSGPGAKGHDGVLKLLAQTKGSIAYLETSSLWVNKYILCAIQNNAGRFLKPSPETLTAAAQSKSIPENFRGSLIDSQGGYAISSFTWLLVPEQGSEPLKREAIKLFLKWTFTNGQTYPDTVGFAPLPKDLAARVQSQIRKIR